MPLSPLECPQQSEPLWHLTGSTLVCWGGGTVYAGNVLRGCFDCTVLHFSSLTEYLLCARDKQREVSKDSLWSRVVLSPVRERGMETSGLPQGRVKQAQKYRLKQYYLGKQRREEEPLETSSFGPSQRNQSPWRVAGMRVN